MLRHQTAEGCAGKLLNSSSIKEHIDCGECGGVMRVKEFLAGLQVFPGRCTWSGREVETKRAHCSEGFGEERMFYYHENLGQPGQGLLFR